MNWNSYKVKKSPLCRSRSLFFDMTFAFHFLSGYERIDIQFDIVIIDTIVYKIIYTCPGCLILCLYSYLFDKNFTSSLCLCLHLAPAINILK